MTLWVDEGGVHKPNGKAVNGVASVTSCYAFPMSPQQRRFWQLDRELPGNPALNGAFRHELTGPLDILLWEAALNELVKRHEALRAHVEPIADGEPMLAVADETTLHLVLRDLRHLAETEREREMERLCVEDAQHRFDVTTGPLIRVGLIRMEDERFVHTLTLHHLICDGWSIGIIMDELPAAYGALVAGKAPELPALDIQFGDYLAWLDESLAGEQIEQETAVWKKRLAGYRRLDLEPDLPRPEGPLLQSDIVSRRLDKELMSRLKAASDRSGSTIFTSALAALMVVLWRETGLADLAVGTPVAGRGRPETEKLVGPLLNHLVLRARAEPEMTLAGFAEAVRDSVFDSFANQEAPLEHIVEALQRDGAAVPQPFYSISFVSHRAFAGGSNFTSKHAGVALKTIPSKSQGALYDAFFFMVEREDGWRLSLDYRTQLFSAERANRLVDDMIVVLADLADRPELRLGEVLPQRQAEPDRQALEAASVVHTQAAGNEAAANEPDGPCVLPASYAQERFWLLSRASPDSAMFNMPVPLRIHGPLDAAVLEQSIRRLIDRHEILRTSFAENDGRLEQVIAPEAAFRLERSELTSVEDQQRELAWKAEARKGAAIAFDLEQAPLMRARLFALGEQENILVLTIHDIAADAQSVGILQRELWRIYEALAAGDEPDLPPVELQYGDFAAWQREWMESEAAREQLAFWQRKLAAPLPVLDFPLDHAPGERQAAVGAKEAVSLEPGLVEALKRLAQAKNATMYAVTGAAFAALLSRFAHQEDILVGSPMVNRTAETEAVVGRFSGPIALRLDVSGDPELGEILERARDGIFEALDNASYPFEELLDHVDARAVNGRNPLFQFYFLYQVAFVQESRTRALTIKPEPSLGMGTAFELQLALIERPAGVAAQLEYNSALIDVASARDVLTYYVGVLEALAADPQRRLSALAEPQVSGRRLGTQRQTPDRSAYVAPRTPTQEGLAELWRDLLKVQQVGIGDDFFALGGQSILAARLVVAIEKRFGVKLSISVLATARTLERQAGLIDAREDHTSAVVVPLKAGREQEPLFLVHCGGGHVLRYQQVVAALPDGPAVYGIQAPPIETIGPQTTVEALAKLYIEKIRAVQPKGPYRLGGYSFGGLVAYEMAAQLRRAGEQVRFVAIFDTANPSYYRDLKKGQRRAMRLLHIAGVAMGYARSIARLDTASIRHRLQDTLENHQRKRAWRKMHRRAEKSGGALGLVQDNFVDELAAVAQSYRPGSFDGRLVLLHARERGIEYRSNPTLGWEQVARHVVVSFVPGDHMTLMLDGNAPVLAEALGDLLRSTDAAG
jgi:thioesterase domain-containing protein/non-ribosomal peptide synthetase component F